MKMLCKEGKSGCGLAKIPLSFFFLFFFNTLFSQVPVNGFCKVSAFGTERGFNNLILTDINFDKKEDVILFDKTSNSLLFHLSTVKNNFTQPIKKFFYFPISKIEEIGHENEKRIFLFLSRKEKLIGLASISKNEKIRLLDIVSYKSTPSSFSIKKDSSGKAVEAIIYGEPFEGISLLKIENDKISEKRIFKENVFKSAVWVDLDYDGIDDIAAYDIFDGELLLLINDGEDNYQLERHVKLGGKLRELKAIDWNGNGYNDLFFSDDDGFEILLGDSVSSFNRKELFKTALTPKKCSVSDFNNDGKPDIAWVEENKSGVFIYYSKSDSSYSKPQKYLSDEIFADIKDFSSNDKKTLFLLSKNGKVFQINNIEEPETQNMLLAEGNPVLLENFKTNRYNDMSLAYFDSLSGSINLLMSNLNIFNTAFQFPAAKNHSEFKMFFTSDSIRTFLLYSKGEKLIEIFRFNIYDYSVNSFKLYADKNICDALAVDSFNGDYLLLLTKENGSAEVVKYQPEGNKFIKQEKLLSEKNVIDATLSFRKFLEVSFLIEKSDSLLLQRKALTNNGIASESVSLGLANEFAPRLFLLNSRKKDYPVAINNDKGLIYFVINEKIKTVSLPKEISLPLKNIKSFYFMGFNYLFILSDNGNTLFEAQLDAKLNYLGNKKFIESETVIDYFGSEFMKFPYLFYINKNHEIKFKKF